MNVIFLLIVQINLSTVHFRQRTHVSIAQTVKSILLVRFTKTEIFNFSAKLNKLPQLHHYS